MFTVIIAFGQDTKFYKGTLPIRTGYDYSSETRYIDGGNVNKTYDNYWKILQQSTTKDIYVNKHSAWTGSFDKLNAAVGRETDFNWLREQSDLAGDITYRLNICTEGVDDEIKLAGYFGCDNRLLGIKIDGVSVYTDESRNTKSTCVPTTHRDDPNGLINPRKCYSWDDQFKCFIEFNEIIIKPELISDGSHSIEFTILNEHQNSPTGLAIDFELKGVKKAWVIPKGGSSDIGRCTPKGVIRGIAFEDEYNCHEYDDDDEGAVNDKLILLYNSSGDLLKEARTNSYGFFSFENLDATQTYEVAYGVNEDDILTFPYDGDAKTLKKEIVTPQRFRDNEFLVVDLRFGFINDEECSSYDIEIDENCASAQSTFKVKTLNEPSSATYTWDLGDGTTLTRPEVYHVYNQAGKYDVKLTVNSSCWCDNEVVLDENIEVIQCANLTGAVFDDKNNCGAFNLDEAAEGESVNLYNDAGQLIETAITNSSGYYLFNRKNLNPSKTYKVQLASIKKLSSPLNSSFYIITPETFKSENYNVRDINFGFLSDNECNINYDLDFASTCIDNAASFDIKNAATETDYLNSNNTYSWDFGDGNTSSQRSGNHQYTDVGNYNVSVTVENSCACDNTVTLTKQIEIEECPDCLECVSSFAPLQSKEYVVSCWVSAENPEGKTYFNDVALVVSFEGSSDVKEFPPTGQVIDGWQRIEGVVTVPGSATKLHLELQNNSQEGFYLDDVRMSPKNSSFVTYVYDPLTLRLVAELDEHNYATVYEYDEEGALIRVKKETERGVQTIQESRNNMRRK